MTNEQFERLQLARKLVCNELNENHGERLDEVFETAVEQCDFRRNELDERAKTKLYAIAIYQWLAYEWTIERTCRVFNLDYHNFCENVDSVLYQITRMLS